MIYLYGLPSYPVPVTPVRQMGKLWGIVGYSRLEVSLIDSMKPRARASG